MVCWSAGGSGLSTGSIRERRDLVRYVIAIAAFAFFLIWDLLYNDSEFLAHGVRILYHAVHWIGV
jgi:hypothetical protein